MDSFLFVSYSRAQRPFAESLALTAIEYGANVWFDLLSLFPGSDWQANIRSGIENCAGVILLVSRESLASPNVAEEMTFALAAQKPLYLAIVESVHLKLKHAPQIDLAVCAHSIIDMRGNFRSAFEKLLTAFRTNAQYRDTVPAPNRLHIPVRLPPPVAEVAIALLAPALGFLATLLYWNPSLSGAGGFVVFDLVVGLVLQAAVFYLFLLRRLSVQSLLNSLVCSDLLFVACWLSQRRFLPGNPVLSPHSIVPSSIGYASFILLCALSCLAIYRLMTSSDLLRWMPPADGLYSFARGSQIRRIAALINSLQKQANQKLDARPYFYALHYAPADAPIAGVVREAFKMSPNVSERMISDQVPTYPAEVVPPRLDFKVLIVTSRLSAAAVTAFLASGGGWPILLLASPIRLTAGLDKGFTRHQWVEFRDMRPTLLGMLVNYMRGLQMARGTYGAFYFPARFESLRGPLGVDAVAGSMRAFAAMCLAAAFIAAGSARAAAPISPFMPMAFLLALWQFGSVHWLYRRSLRFWPFCLSVAASLALATALGVPQLLQQRSPAYSSFLMLFAALLIWGLWRLRSRWFPVSGQAGQTLPGPSHLSIAAGHLPYLLIALFIWAGYAAMNEN